VRRRRPRYAGKHPRRFEEKYKEHDPAKYSDTVARVVAAGKTPAGTHRPILVAEVLEVLRPSPGEVAVDATLGYGGHARELLGRVTPGGRVIALDADPIELPKTEARLRAAGWGPEVFTAHRSNYAGLARVLAGEGLAGVDLVLADLGLSSMQIDDPARGFSVKAEGPLDMRMNPRKGQPAAAWLASVTASELESVLVEGGDEPRAGVLAEGLAGGRFATTRELAEAVRRVLARLDEEEQARSVRRVFQAVRIAVNEEFTALELFLRQLPLCLNPGGRVAVLTFHSGEDRRVKQAFLSGLRDGTYAGVARDVVRPGPEERRANPRSTPAKLRWAVKA
jgi:16S rRNA (cytosine1402-N4)-methyltransferase